MSAAKTRVVSTEELRGLSDAARSVGFRTTVAPMLNLDPRGLHLLEMVTLLGDPADEEVSARIRAVVLAKIDGKESAHMCLIEVLLPDWLALPTLEQVESERDEAAMKWLARR